MKTTEQRALKKQYDRARYVANPDKKRASTAAWQAIHSKEVKAAGRARYARDPEKYKAKAKKYKDAHPEATRAAASAWVVAHPEQAKATRKKYRASDKFKGTIRKLKYGLCPEEFTRMLEVQNYQCAGCKMVFTPTFTPRVDHNHLTDKIRGLLCHNCNVILGLAHDSKSVLSGLLKYLERTE